MKKWLLIFPILMGFNFTANSAVKTQLINYTDGDASLQGYLAYDDAVQTKRPAVLIIHEWRGLDDYVKGRAKQLAGMGYVAFAADMYGKGKYAKDHQEAGEWSGMLLKDRTTLRNRALVGLAILKKQSQADVKKLVVIGYCFGGAAALELARAGEILAGVVTFHGNLSNPSPETTGKIKAKILVCQGAKDNFTLSQIPAFEDEMKKAKADYQIIYYADAVHSFTVPTAGNDSSTGMAYNEAADKKSWDDMKKFFSKIFQ